MSDLCSTPLSAMRILISLIVLFLLSACTGFVPGELPDVGRVSAEDIGFDRVSLRSMVMNSSKVKESGFIVSDTARYSVKLSPDGILELELTGLKPGTEYHAVAFIGNGVNTLVSDLSSFCTNAQFPDIVFREHVLSRYDFDGDGFISESEALSVTELSVPAERMYEMKSAEGVVMFRNLRSLSMTGSWEGKASLQSLDLSGMTALSDIYLMWGKLQSLTLPSGMRVVGNIALDYNFLTGIDFRDIEQAGIIQLNYNRVKSLDMSRFTKVDQLSCIGNDLSELDLTSITSMGCLLCRENPNLKTLKINSRCQIHQLEADPWTKIIYVD